MLPILATIIFVGGVGASTVIAFWWPLMRIGNEMELTHVVTEPAVDGSVFNVPLFMLGAGPSLVAAVLLLAASSIVDELRRLRAGS